MTTEEINLVKNSWKLLRYVKPEIIGDVFYAKLFIESPQLKPLFKSSVEEQSRKFITILNLIIARLENMEGLHETIRELAIRHKHYGVKTFHYEPVGYALLWTIETALGADWTETVGKAWAKCYTTLASVMIEATHTSPAG